MSLVISKTFIVNVGIKIQKYFVLIIILKEKWIRNCHLCKIRRIIVLEKTATLINENKMTKTLKIYFVKGKSSD